MSIALFLCAVVWMALYARFYRRGLQTNLPGRHGWDAQIIGSGLAATIYGLPVFAILVVASLLRGF